MFTFIVEDMTALPGSGGDVADLDARQELLDHLIRDINDFLAHRVQRLDREMREWCAFSAPAPVSQTRLDEFEQQKRQWEATRMREAQSIRERCDQLTAAWLQLEAEQRRWLQTRQEPPGQAPAGLVQAPVKQAIRAGALAANANDDDRMRRLDGAGVGNSSPPRTDSVAPATRSRDAAFRQFRQLRQEVSATGPIANRF